MFVKKYLKWISTFLVTFLVLVGILLTNLNIYPLNIYFHGLGVVGWTVAGFISKVLTSSFLPERFIDCLNLLM